MRIGLPPAKNLFAVAALLALPGAAVQAAPTLTPHKALYDVRISVLSGTLTSEVTAAPPGFMANSVIEPKGMARLVARGAIQESSFFLLDSAGILPTQYRSIDTMSGDEQHVDLDFNWREHTVRGTVDDEEFETELNGRVHDRLSIQYELMLDLMNGGAEEQYQLLDADELKVLIVKNVGMKELKVPFGTFKAVGIQHNKENSTRITTLWCAEELGYLPVVIEQHRKGKLRVRAVLRSYEPVADESVASASPAAPRR